ncbi:MAG TPA: hypothetical protein VGO62_06160, partial [Myxococcota bacterium]
MHTSSLPRLLLALACVSALCASAAGADEPEAGDSSLIKLVDDVASSLEKRAALEHVSGPMKLEVTPSRGIDAQKVERGFQARLKKRLKEGGTLIPTVDAPLRCRLTLSEEGGFVWATALLEGGALTGPSAVAVSRVIDRELDASLGAVVKGAQTRYVLERLGTVPAGVLDIALVDVDSDGIDELAILGVDGLRLFRAGGSHIEKMGPVQKLAARRWPRVATGWLARLDGNRLWAVTSAGHSTIFDAKTLHQEPGPADLVPFRGAPGPRGPLCGQFRLGSPVMALPLASMQGQLVRTAGLPARVRDLAAAPLSPAMRLAPNKSATPGWLAPAGYVVVDADGQLLAQHGTDPPTLLATEKVGDRLLVADLDGDGDSEILTTSAAPTGEADHLVLRHVSDDLATSTE